MGRGVSIYVYIYIHIYIHIHIHIYIDVYGYKQMIGGAIYIYRITNMNITTNMKMHTKVDVPLVRSAL